MHSRLSQLTLGLVVLVALFIVLSCDRDAKEAADNRHPGAQTEMRHPPSRGDTVSRSGGHRGREGMRRGGDIPGRIGGPALIPVEVCRIDRREMFDYILASTTLEPLRAVEVYAKTTGIVEDLLVEEGDDVSSGDTLVVLDDREAGLNLRRAEIEFREAGNSMGRSREMISRNLISQEEFETAGLAYENAKTSLSEAKLAMEYTRVTAPIAGRITERFVELGSMVNQGKVLFSLADFNPLRARIYIPEKELRRLEIGQQVLLKVESEPGKEFPAVVELISSVIDPSSGTFKVTIEVKSSGGELRPGMFASAKIIVDRHPDAPVTRAEAILYDGKQRYIYVVRNGAATRVDVETGFADEGFVEISGSVEDGEMVVVTGHNNLASGIRVEVVKDLSGGKDSRPDVLEGRTRALKPPPAGRDNR